MSEPTAAVTQGGRKKLRDMTDFFNPVESADIWREGGTEGGLAEWPYEDEDSFFR
jgi:hypothetical protein